jgi:Bacterial Ig domain
MKNLRLIIILSISLVLSACGSSPTSAPAVVPSTLALTTIVVSPQGDSVQAGNPEQFSAVAEDQNGTPLVVQPTFQWSTTLGGISASGDLSVNCLTGTATVTASSGGIKGTASITVTKYVPALQTITLSPGSVSLNDSGTGSTAQLTAAATDQCNQSLAETFTYTSSNPAVITSHSGAVQAVNQGQSTAQVSSTITASAGSPVVTSNPVSVLVNPVPPPTTAVATVVITPGTIPTLTVPDANGFVGSGLATYQLTATAYNSIGAIVPLTGTWTSGSAASVNPEGLVSAQVEGTAQVQYIASTTGENSDPISVYSNVVDVTVAPAPQATTITVTPMSATIVNTVTATFNPQELDQYQDVWPNSVYTTTAPSNGSVSINPNQSISYTPNAGYVGTDSFAVYDPNTSATPATVTVNVTAPINLQGPWEIYNGVGLGQTATYFEVNITQSGSTITASQAVGVPAPTAAPTFGPWTTAAAIDLAYNGTSVVGTVNTSGLVTLAGCSGYPVTTSAGTTISNCAHSVPVLPAGTYSGMANVSVAGSVTGYCDGTNGTPLTAVIGTPAANYQWGVSYSCDWVQSSFSSPAPGTVIAAPMMQIGDFLYFYGTLTLSNNTYSPMYGSTGDPAINLSDGFALSQ